MTMNLRDPKKQSCHKMCPVCDNPDQITSDIGFSVPGRPSQCWHDITDAQSLTGKEKSLQSEGDKFPPQAAAGGS